MLVKGVLRITATVSVPEREVRLRASRSAGPGGQHVNKVSTRVTLYFDVTGSPSLTAAHKRRICARLGTRITKEGILYLSAQRFCSQSVNRADVLEKFCRLLYEALTPRKIRKPVPTPRQSIERRLDQKKRQRRVKQLRTRPVWQDE